MRFPVLAGFLTVLLASCRGGGSDPDASPDTPPVDIPCTGSYSGDVTGTFSCAVVATHTSGSNTSFLGFTISNLQGTALDVSLAGLEWSGAFVTGAYSETSASVVTAYEVVTGGTQASPVAYLSTKNWLGTDLGAFTLRVDTAVVSNGTATPPTYTAHGTFTATLVKYPAPSTPASVTVAVTF